MTLSDLKKLGPYFTAVFLIATFCSVLAWAFTISYTAWRDIEGVDALDVAQNAFFISAVLGIVGALVVLIIEG